MTAQPERIGHLLADQVIDHHLGAVEHVLGHWGSSRAAVILPASPPEQRLMHSCGRTGLRSTSEISNLAAWHHRHYDHKIIRDLIERLMDIRPIRADEDHRAALTSLATPGVPDHGCVRC